MRGKMQNINQPCEDLKGKWILLDKKNNVIFASYKPVDVIRKGKEYPYGDVSIEKILKMIFTLSDNF
jgi:hypothetical protein